MKKLKWYITIIIYIDVIFEPCRIKLFCLFQETELYEPNSSSYQIDGRRIVELYYFFEKLKSVSDHNLSLGCTLSNIEITRENIVGLESEIFLKCQICKETFSITLNNKLPHEISINHAAVTSSMLIGRTSLNELLLSMDLPNFSSYLYDKHLSEVSKWWATAAENSIKEAAEQQMEIAIEKSDVADGDPCITVLTNGCWSKRSFRINYSATSRF